MTAEELFSRASEIAHAVRNTNGAEQYMELCPKLLRHMHETLVMACAMLLTYSQCVATAIPRSR